MQKPVEKPIKFIKNVATNGKSYPITHVSAVIDDNGESIKSTIDSLKNKPSMTKVTWQELKDKRDAGKLIPGSLYRITDYQCTTTQANTQSAGHQFDIVLLALSENKLAEEGWAMMNESNIYDVTFADGVTKKCWIYDNSINPLEKYNVVNVKTLKGFVFAEHAIQINEENKTASLIDGYDSDLLDEFDDLTYNYFQNSNLSAWKVWYSLDNDKSRFAWADDSVDEGSPASIMFSDGIERTAIRNANQDTEDYYCWIVEGLKEMPYYTEKEIPDVGDMVYQSDHGMIQEIGRGVEVYNPPTQGTGLPNGRGVIYRLIDEFNNDIKYDFKNIQFKRALTDGEYDPDEGEDVWCYTFTWIDEDGEAVDASVFCQNIAGDEGFVYGVHDNSMLPCIEYDFYPEEHSDKLAFALNDNVFISSYEYEGGVFYGIYGNHFDSICYSNTFGNDCYNNSFGNNCQNNTFGNNCYNNSFGNNCQNNTFGNYCSGNTFGNYCYNNSFGNDCYNNSFGNSCSNNSFGNSCSNNTFGNYCSGNTFGNYCYSNTFGNDCFSNTFGNNFLSSSIGDSVNNVKVNKDYVQFILIENGNRYITITSTATTSSTFRLENFAIALGVNNGGNMKTISHNTTNDTFKTTYQNSNSTTKNV